MCEKLTKKEHYKEAKSLINKYGTDKGLNKYFSYRAAKNDQRFINLETKVKLLETNHIKHLAKELEGLHSDIEEIKSKI